MIIQRITEGFIIWDLFGTDIQLMNGNMENTFSYVFHSVITKNKSRFY